MPDDVAAACVGASECRPWAEPTATYNRWFSCASADPASCVPSRTQARSAAIPPHSKMKMAALCG